MNASLVIRAAQPRDLDSINALMHASSAYQGEYYRIIENYFVTADYLARNKVFVAERGNELLGFYGLIVDGEPDLDLMFVADVAQGLGMGRALFEHMKQTARTRGIASVQIGSHPPAVGFYESMGAVRVGMCPPLKNVTWERPLLKLDLVEA